MYVITYKGKPATIARIHQAECFAPSSFYTEEELATYIAAPSARKAKAMFLYHIGCAWKYRSEGIEVQKVEVVK